MSCITHNTLPNCTTQLSNLCKTVVSAVKWLAEKIVKIVKLIFILIGAAVLLPLIVLYKLLCARPSYPSAIPVPIVTRNPFNNDQASGHHFRNIFGGFSVSAPSTENASIRIGDFPQTPFQSLTVNHDRLRDTPPAFDPSTIYRVVEETRPRILTSELLTIFDNIFSSTHSQATLFTDDGGYQITKASARRSIETSYLDWINQYTRSLYQNDSDRDTRLANSMKNYLLGTIFELRKGDIPLDKKKEVLLNLAAASFHCPPRRHEQAQKAYFTLCNQIETLDDILLKYIQQTKEDLIIQHYSLSTEPVMTLNFIRKKVGSELGLDCNPVNLEDQYIHLHDARSPDNQYNKHTSRQDFLKVFSSIFKAENIINIMKEFLNNRITQDNAFAAELSQYIDNAIRAHVQAGHLNQADADELPEPYQDPNTYHLTDAGVKFLLVENRFLNHAQRNGHLVTSSS